MRRFVIAAVLALFALPALADVMAQHLGKDRPILIFAPDRYDKRLIDQIGRFSMHRREFRDRDVKIIEIGGPFMRVDGRAIPNAPEVRARFGIADQDFTLILVGKDGMEKFRTSQITDPRLLYDLIDEMPLRTQETGSN